VHFEPNGRILDEDYSLNPQSGTQWDGFRHFCHFDSRQFYNGVTAAEILPTSGSPSPTRKLGIDAWARKGIVASALLLDFAAWAEREGVILDHFNSGEITLAQLEAVGRAQGIDIHNDIPPGTLLIIRSGWLRADFALTQEEREKRHNGGQTWSGVQPCEEMAEWLHDRWFCAVAGDGPAFEAWGGGKVENGWMHQRLLALWGSPIGELWDLERLSERCSEEGRWWVCVVSQPGNVEGGVGSMGNVMAIL
jgi:kynurenine formamidase